MRGIAKKLVLMVPAIGALVAAAPASAAVGAGVGSVTGTVTLSPGYAIPPAASSPQAFTFNSIEITGVFVAATPATVCATSTLQALGVTGNSGAPLPIHNIAADSGPVNPFTAAGACNLASVGGDGTKTVSTVTNGGTFIRIGPLVITVFLGANCTVNGDSAGCEIVVVAEFNPHSPTQNPATDFDFRGVYAAAG